MRVKIVFNGREYADAEAMPPDVRQEYEATLELVSKTGDRDMVSKLWDVLGLRVQATIRRKIVVDGKQYASIDELPPEIRQRFERAVAGKALSGAAVASLAHAPAAPRPRALPDDQARRGPWLRIAWWIAIGVLLAVWLIRRG